MPLLPQQFVWRQLWAFAFAAALLLLAAPPLARASNPFFSGDSYTTELTDANFNEYVGREQGVLLEFYTPWCAYCKRFAPIYELVGHAFQRERRVLIARLDASAYPEVKEHFGVTGFPTLKFFPANQEVLAPAEFSGSRTAPALVAFVNEQAGTRAYLKGAAAAANQIPTLNEESKARMKERWSKNMADQQMASPSLPSAAPTAPSGFQRPPVVRSEPVVDPEQFGVDKRNVDISQEEALKLHARKEELRRQLEGMEAPNAERSSGRKKQKKKRIKEEL